GFAEASRSDASRPGGSEPRSALAVDAGDSAAVDPLTAAVAVRSAACPACTPVGALCLLHAPARPTATIVPTTRQTLMRDIFLLCSGSRGAPGTLALSTQHLALLFFLASKPLATAPEAETRPWLTAGNRRKSKKSGG